MESFKNQGFIHLKGLLSPEEIAYYRQLLQKVSGLNDNSFQPNKAHNGYSQADGVVKNPSFWPLIYHERLIAALNNILPVAPRFLQHTDLHVHHGAVGWHRDNAHRTFNKGKDWDESEHPYLVLRVSIYLQSFAESQFKMGLIPGSHRKENLINYLELKASAVYRRLTGQLPPFYFSLKPTWINIEPGDVLIFDQRVLHTGTKIKGPKYSIYLGYGADNPHAKRHSDYFYRRADLHYEKLPHQLAKILNEKSLLPSFFNEALEEVK